MLENGHVVLEDTGDALLANEAVRSAYLRVPVRRDLASFIRRFVAPGQALRRPREPESHQSSDSGRLF